MLAALNTFDASVQKGILRVLGCLALHNDAFKARMLMPAMIARIAGCLTSSDAELANWAVVLIHDLAMLGEQACRVILTSPGVIGALSVLMTRGSAAFCRLTAETLGFICSHDSLHEAAIEAQVLRIILPLATSDDAEQQFWGAAMVLCLAASPNVRPALVAADVANVMATLAARTPDSEPEATVDAVHASRSQICAMATRVLVSLSYQHTQAEQLLVNEVSWENY